MSEDIKWTDAQQAAIDAKGNDILVSASAGSGKTAVLIERIIRNILDEEQKADITRMLIVTFTDAAATQLKEKLAKALKSAIRENPEKKFLRRQLADLPRAAVATINSYCLSIVKNNFEALSLSANLRIADEAENKLIMLDIMDQSIEDFYNRGEELGIPDFANFCDSFANLSDFALADIFLKLYNSLYSQLEGLELIKTNAEALEAAQDCDPFENKWGLEIKKRTELFIEDSKKKYSQINDILDFCPDVKRGYGSAIENDLEAISGFERALAEGYDEISKVITSFKPVSIGRYSSKGENIAEAARVKALRESFKNVFENIASCYNNDIGNAKLFCAKTARFNRELYTFLSHFHVKLMAEKQKRGVVSFSDCEALSLKILCENGEPTKIAQSYRERYDEVYIDEYQDLNSVQDCIFRMISPENSRFLVGDIKQSIYGFRGAQPSIFASYRERFADYMSEEESEGKRIFLSNNFRSSENIIKFANAVSRGCFVDAESSVGYYDGDDLIFSKTKEDEADGSPVTLAIVQENEEKNAEAAYVAEEIKKLCESGVAPGEITILLRKMTNADVYTKELEKRGIPYYCDLKKEFFSNPEIMLTLCWLNTIDNTRRDDYVCGILKSPIYNFTLDDLTVIRSKCPRDTLYNSVKAYTEEYSFEKGRYFISDIEELRLVSRGKTARELLWYLMYEKKLMNILTKSKNKALARVTRNNLLLLYDYAKNFENGEFKGLNNFIKYIEQIIEEGHYLPTAAAFAGAGDTVKVMTVHKSKGLEFPYCFICGTHLTTSKKDMQKKLLFHRKLGIAAKIADESGLAYYDTYIMSAMRLAIEEEAIESEYLVLYVALTRAINRMWICCSAKDPSALEEKYIRENITKLYTIINNSYIAWILPSLKYAPKECYSLIHVRQESEKGYEFSPESNKTAETGDKAVDKEFMKMLESNTVFEYPYSKAWLVPAKMAVSKLYPDMLDDEVSLDMSAILKPKVPFFADNANTNMGAQIGNATHAFMQFCDFARVENMGVEAELEYLCEKRFISRNAAELVDTEALNRFFESDIYSQIRGAKRIYREKRFNVNLSASAFSREYSDELSEETVLVQGVIDCFIYNDDGEIILIDYKTDYIPSSVPASKAEDILKKRHSQQLGYYKLALEHITGDKVSKALIYSFALNKALEI